MCETAISLQNRGAVEEPVTTLSRPHRRFWALHVQRIGVSLSRILEPCKVHLVVGGMETQRTTEMVVNPRKVQGNCEGYADSPSHMPSAVGKRIAPRRAAQTCPPTPVSAQDRSPSPWGTDIIQYSYTNSQYTNRLPSLGEPCQISYNERSQDVVPSTRSCEPRNSVAAISSTSHDSKGRRRRVEAFGTELP